MSGNLFTTQNLVMGVLLSGMAFGLNAIVVGNSAIASLESDQKENARVNQLVYGMESTLVSVNHNMSLVQQEIKDLKVAVKSFEETDLRMKLKMHCILDYSEPKERDKCVAAGRDIATR